METNKLRYKITWDGTTCLEFIIKYMATKRFVILFLLDLLLSVLTVAAIILCACNVLMLIDKYGN